MAERAVAYLEQFWFANCPECGERVPIGSNRLTWKPGDVMHPFCDECDSEFEVTGPALSQRKTKSEREENTK